MRALSLIAAALALVLASVASAARDPNQPQQHHTAADTKLAKKIALRKTDFAAGWKLAPASKPGPPCTVAPDESKLVQTARIDPTFVYRNGVPNVGSEVDIFKTAAQARVDWKLSSLALTRECLLQGARHDLGKKVAVTSAKALAPPPGAERSLHYRFVFELRGTSAVPIVTDVVALGKGRITVVLHTVTVGKPIAAKALSALATLLAGRLGGAGIGGI